MNGPLRRSLLRVLVVASLLLLATSAVQSAADTTPPTTTIILSGTPGNDGWYTSDVQVSFAAADEPGGSGVARTEYSFDGLHWLLYAGQQTVTLFQDHFDGPPSA